MLAEAAELTGWERIHIPHEKRKYPNPEVCEFTITLRGYDAVVRQVIVRGNGHQKPAFLISNDFTGSANFLVGNYARRWRIENGIGEVVKFFHLNALSSPILVKVHFDLALTVLADTLYGILAQKLHGFERCDAPKLYRDFVRGKRDVKVQGSTVTVTYPRRPHNPILRKVPWQHLPQQLPGLEGANLALRFR